MVNNAKIVKIYDSDRNFLKKGHLLSISGGVIKVRGQNMPDLRSGDKIIIEIYCNLTGISSYNCVVGIAASNQLNAHIETFNPTVERRKSLKIRTDLSFYVDSLMRNDEDVTEDFPSMKINVLNLSIGGMLISSNYDLNIDDILTFYFQHEKSQVVLLKARIIRIDKAYDDATSNVSFLNYGCIFSDLSLSDEAVVSRYLYDRQIQLYRNK